MTSAARFRIPALALALLGIGVAVLLLTEGKGPVAPEEPAPSDDPAVTSPESPPESLPAEEVVNAAPTGAAEKGAYAGRIRFAGTGREPGTFSFDLVSRSASGERIPVRGENGRFTVVLPHAGKYFVGKIRTDGEDYGEEWVRVDARAGEPLAIVLQEAVRVSLIAVDAETGASLAGARAYRATHGGLGEAVEVPRPDGSVLRHAHPPAKTFARPPIVADGSGRIPLGAGRGTHTFYVVSDGYAFTAVEVPFAVATEIRVGLLAGGSVALRVIGWTALSSPALRVRPEGTVKDLRLPGPDESGEILLEGLLAGTHRFTVLRRVSHGGGEEAGASSCEVVAGRSVPLVIEAEPGEEPEVPITGTLTVPEGWGRFARALHFQRQVKPHIMAHGDYVTLRPPDVGDTVEFRTKAVSPGTYFVEVQPFQWRARVEVPAAGAHLKLVLPGPVELLVAVVDDATGEPVPAAEVAWHLSSPGLTSYSLDSIPWSAARGRFRVLVPPGEIRVDVSADGYLDRDVPVQAGLAGRIEETVRLTLGGSIRVRFELDGKAYPSDDVRVMVGNANGATSRRAGADGVDFPSLAPGKYTLLVKEIAGMKPVPSQDVEVRRGEAVDVVIELERLQ